METLLALEPLPTAVIAFNDRYLWGIYQHGLRIPGAIPLDQIITDIRPLSQLETGFKQMESGGSVMKILLEA